MDEIIQGQTLFMIDSIRVENHTASVGTETETQVSKQKMLWNGEIGGIPKDELF